MPCAWNFSIILILLDVSRKYLFSWNKTRITLFVHQKGKTRITIQEVWLQIYAMLSSSLCSQDSSIIPFKFSSNVCHRTVSIQTTLYNRKFSRVTFLGVELMSNEGDERAQEFCQLCDETYKRSLLLSSNIFRCRFRFIFEIGQQSS